MPHRSGRTRALALAALMTAASLSWVPVDRLRRGDQ